jgi:hypothetical protein
MRPARESDWFADKSEESNLSFTYHDGSDGQCYQLLESVGGGVAIFDADKDQRQDLFITGGGRVSTSDGNIVVAGLPGGLFRQSSSNRYVSVGVQAKVSEPANLYTHGCTVLDFDSDGFGDLFVAGFEGVQLWHNSGDGTFVDVAATLGIEARGWNVSAAAGDFNRDGLVDIYLLTYADWKPDANQKCMNDQGLRDICGPTLYPGSRDHLFENTGTGFHDVTERVQLVPANRGLGLVTADIDENGFLDMIVVNDVQENQLYLGDESGVFHETGVLAGVAYSNTGEREGSMGVDLGDFDADGRPDLWYTNYTQQDNSLLKNLSGRGFVHSADVAGLSGVSRPWVGFGTGFADFDGDGWEDLFVANGHVAYERRDSPYFQPPQFFRNQQGERFVELKSEGGAYFDSTWSGRGAAKGDLNDDGALDLVIVHQNEPAAVLMNRHQIQNWVSVILVGTGSDRNSIGAVASVADSGRILKRWVLGGGSYLSHSDSRLYFALSQSEPADVTVTWLGGTEEKFVGLKPGMTHTLVEGRGQHVAP